MEDSFTDEVGPAVPEAPGLTAQRLPTAVRVRTFYGDTGRCQEWRREVDTMKLLYKISDEQMAGLVCLALDPGEGKPRDLLSHLEVNEICTSEGYREIFKVLDREYQKEAYVKADDAQAKYERCARRPNQKMEEYIRELKTAKRLLRRKTQVEQFLT